MRSMTLIKPSPPSKENEVKERPILFSTPMVRALLEGRKTQTRRVIKPIHFKGEGAHVNNCPFGKTGDILWVRETLEKANGEAVGYPADGTWFPNTPWRWKRDTLPSIFMPRAFCRLRLEITGVRVERLRDISCDDAVSEGWPGTESAEAPQRWFRSLWWKINGEESWAANPFVWVVEFKKC